MARLALAGGFNGSGGDEPPQGPDWDAKTPVVPEYKGGQALKDLLSQRHPLYEVARTTGLNFDHLQDGIFGLDYLRPDEACILGKYFGVDPNIFLEGRPSEPEPAARTKEQSATILKIGELKPPISRP